MAPTRTRSKSLPENPSAEYLRKEAKRLARVEAIQLTTAQHRLARQYGYRNWSQLMRHVRALSTAFKAPRGPYDATGAKVSVPQPELERLLKRPVTDLQLSMRALIGLDSKNIRYIADLVGYAEQDLLAIKNLGRKSLNEIKIALGRFGFSLATRFEVENNLPFLPLRELVAFPHVVYPVLVDRSSSIKAIKSAQDRKIPIVMAAQKDPAVESPGDAHIFRIGVVGNLCKVVDLLDGTLKALVEGKRRVRVSRLATDGEFITARTEELTEPATERLDELLQSVASAFVSSRSKWLGSNRPIQVPGIWGRMPIRVPGHPSTWRSVFATTRANPSIVADRIASHLPIEMSQKQELLELLDPAVRLEKLLPHLTSQIFAVGDEVKVLGGAFVDLEGAIKEVRPAEGKVRVAISIFGRSETIELDFSQIRPATPE